MNSPTTEWVVVPDNTAVIASETGEVWFLELDPGDETSPFAKPMTGKGTRGSTGALLNGVVSLGFGRNAGDNLHSASLPRYVFDLVGSYHNSRRTPGHFLQAAKRFREIDRPDLAAYLETHAREETGHERLVLKDLRALGLPAERIVENLFPEGIKPVWEFFDRLTAADYPIGSIGYSYCFEYTAALKKEPEVDALAALSPPGIDASRFLRTHSGLGSEVSHVDDMVDFIAGLPVTDRIEIVKVAYDTAVKLAGGLRRHSLMSETEILAKLQAAAGQEIRLGGG
jgi:hypothetical protein